MNRRQYKKFKKKLFQKNYKNYRLREILNFANKILDERQKIEDIGTPMIRILQTKKGKYLFPPQIFTNVCLMGINNNDSYKTKEITLEWNCKPVSVNESIEEAADKLKQVYSILDQNEYDKNQIAGVIGNMIQADTREKPSTLQKMLRSWREGIEDGSETESIE